MGNRTPKHKEPRTRKPKAARVPWLTQPQKNSPGKIRNGHLRQVGAPFRFWAEGARNPETGAVFRCEVCGSHTVKQIYSVARGGSKSCSAKCAANIRKKNSDVNPGLDRSFLCGDRSHFLDLDGRRATVTELSREVGIPAKNLFDRLRRGWDIRRTLTQPIQVRRSPGKRPASEKAHAADPKKLAKDES